MNTAVTAQRTDRPAAADSVQMLCWLFQRRDDAVTCEVDFDARHSAYDVTVIPPRASSGVHVERFDRASTALQRHAQIAAQLRQAGWTVAGYGHAGGSALPKRHHARAATLSARQTNETWRNRR